MLKDTWWYNW